MLDFTIKIKLKDKNDDINFALPMFKLATCKNSDIDKFETNFYFNYHERQLLAEEKSKIDEKNALKDWDKSKKISNAYELIHISNNKMKSESISKYIPLSRSFFKLWEIINYFNLINTKESIVTGHLAEGPGGFLEACLYYRNRLLKITPLMDKYFGITLKPYSKEIPGWNKANELIYQFKNNIEIGYGSDNTGDLYKVHNIRSFTRKIKNNSDGADLITADGGFDFSINFNKQEVMSHRLILSELLTGIKSQKIGGAFVCKLFDSYSHLTIQLLYFISCLYQEVYLIKPLTSRPANSEKYMVALSYIGFNSIKKEQYYICLLENILYNWNDIINNDYIFQSIFEEPPIEFYNRIDEYNKQSFNQQKIYLEKTLDIITNKPDWKELEIIFNEQTEKAVNWCRAYNLPITIDSYFYQKYQLKKNKQSNYENKTYNNTVNTTDNTTVNTEVNTEVNTTTVSKKEEIKLLEKEDEQKEVKYKKYIEELDNYFEKFIGY